MNVHWGNVEIVGHFDGFARSVRHLFATLGGFWTRSVSEHARKLQPQDEGAPMSDASARKATSSAREPRAMTASTKSFRQAAGDLGFGTALPHRAMRNRGDGDRESVGGDPVGVVAEDSGKSLRSFRKANPWPSARFSRLAAGHTGWKSRRR
jgi:hypothetical protein